MVLRLLGLLSGCGCRLVRYEILGLDFGWNSAFEFGVS